MGAVDELSWQLLQEVAVVTVMLDITRLLGGCENPILIAVPYLATTIDDDDGEL